MCLGDSVIAAELIEAGADLDSADIVGQTPLMVAATRGIVHVF